MIVFHGVAEHSAAQVDGIAGHTAWGPQPWGTQSGARFLQIKLNK
jgi:hypothetical protein